MIRCSSQPRRKPQLLWTKKVHTTLKITTAKISFEKKGESGCLMPRISSGTLLITCEKTKSSGWARVLTSQSSCVGLWCTLWKRHSQGISWLSRCAQ